jgi:hypothetical protein
MSDSAGIDETPAEGAMERAVRDSIDALAPTEKVPKHRALALLAVDYARVLDANRGDPETLLDFGPKLQSALVALGCAPTKAVQPASTGGGEKVDTRRAALARLRSVPSAGANRTA